MPVLKIVPLILLCKAGTGSRDSHSSMRRNYSFRIHVAHFSLPSASRRLPENRRADSQVVGRAAEETFK